MWCTPWLGRGSTLALLTFSSWPLLWRMQWRQGVTSGIWACSRCAVLQTASLIMSSPISWQLTSALLSSVCGRLKCCFVCAGDV